MRQTLAMMMMVFLAVSGCVTDSDVIRGDHSAWVQRMARERGMHDLNCNSALATRPIRSDRMADRWDPLFSEYSVWVEGCGKSIRYQLKCEEENICSFSNI